MDCPKCLSAMEAIVYSGIEIDRCTECFGLLFDHLEKEDLMAIKGAERIDIGDDIVGARFNEILDVVCPKCKVKMDHVVEQQPHEIKFESCPECHAAWFDAGEFRDYMQEDAFAQLQHMVPD